MRRTKYHLVICGCHNQSRIYKVASSERRNAYGSSGPTLFNVACTRRDGPARGIPALFVLDILVRDRSLVVGGGMALTRLAAWRTV